MLFIQLLLLFNSFFTPADNNICRLPNTSFKEGEKIKYSIYYNVIGIYVNAGKAEFNTQLSSFEGKDTYTFTAIGKSNTRYDWIFKVRDVYESIVDIKTLLPYQFTRRINEGSFHQADLINFNQKNKTASTSGNTYSTSDCTYDVISAIYAARNINYDNLQLNEKVYLNFFLDKELYPSYFKRKRIILTRSIKQ